VTAAWVIPSIDPAFGKACQESLSPEVRERLCVVDNTEHNHGVAASWNIGIRHAAAIGADWLVICSESMRFGPAGGKDFEAGLAGLAGLVMGRCDQTCTQVIDTGQGFCQNGYGWHLIGLHMGTVERVGLFDEIFYPAWWEDADYKRRMHLAKILEDEPVDGVDAHLAACEHTLASGALGGVGWWTTMSRYELKWGGLAGEERWIHPYNDPRLDWRFTGEQQLADARRRGQPK
jgi:hypothetical protein